MVSQRIQFYETEVWRGSTKAQTDLKHIDHYIKMVTMIITGSMNRRIYKMPAAWHFCIVTSQTQSLILRQLCSEGTGGLSLPETNAAEVSSSPAQRVA